MLHNTNSAIQCPSPEIVYSTQNVVFLKWNRVRVRVSGGPSGITSAPECGTPGSFKSGVKVSTNKVAKNVINI